MRTDRVVEVLVRQGSVWRERHCRKLGIRPKIPIPFETLVEFLEGRGSPRVVGFKVKAGFVAGISSASETNKLQSGLPVDKGRFQLLHKRTRRTTSGRDERANGGQLIRAHVDNNEKESGGCCSELEKQKRVETGTNQRQEPDEGHVWPRGRGRQGMHTRTGEVDK
jgi:hypothetical protein